MLLDKQRIKRMKHTLGLSTCSQFCGFVIHVPRRDEFIASINESGFRKLIGYTSIPDYAIKYKRYDKALKASKKCDKYKTVIGYLFDLGEHHYVGLEE
jgi:hypothetical protein